MKKSFATATSRGISKQLLFSILRVVLTVLDQWLTGLNLAKVRNMNNHFGTEEVIVIPEGHLSDVKKMLKFFNNVK